MVAMRMMQPAVHQIVDMIAVRNGLVTASRTMNVTVLMSRMTKLRRAFVGIVGADFDHMLLNDIATLMMQMAVVQVVDMIAVSDRDMAARGAVLVRVISVNVLRHLLSFPSLKLMGSAQGQWVSQACSIALSTRLRTCLSASE